MRKILLFTASLALIMLGGVNSAQAGSNPPPDKERELNDIVRLWCAVKTGLCLAVTPRCTRRSRSPTRATVPCSRLPRSQQ